MTMLISKVGKQFMVFCGGGGIFVFFYYFTVFSFMFNQVFKIATSRLSKPY